MKSKRIDVGAYELQGACEVHAEIARLGRSKIIDLNCRILYGEIPGGNLNAASARKSCRPTNGSEKLSRKKTIIIQKDFPLWGGYVYMAHGPGAEIL